MKAFRKIKKEMITDIIMFLLLALAIGLLIFIF